MSQITLPPASLLISSSWASSAFWTVLKLDVDRSPVSTTMTITEAEAPPGSFAPTMAVPTPSPLTVHDAPLAVIEAMVFEVVDQEMPSRPIVAEAVRDHFAPLPIITMPRLLSVSTLPSAPTPPPPALKSPTITSQVAFLLL